MASSQSTVCKTCHDLPFEITIEILSRLPVKSLLRFKSVCKTWYDLIETPDFISKHLRTQVTLVSTSLLETTINLAAGTYGFLLICYDGFDNDRVNIDFPFLDRLKNYGTSYDESLTIVGICNGLVCIRLSQVGYPLILCNPSTRKFQEISGAELNWFDENIHYYDEQLISFGFGFHPSANDYKLIRIILYYDAHSRRNIRADLYVMSTNTWTKNDANKLLLFSEEIDEWGESASAVLNGVFYWLAHIDPTYQVVVMSFDMGDEVFRKIRIPECLNIETNCKFVELNDKLALVVCSDAEGFDVWVLNEDESSWTNQVKVGFLPTIASMMRHGELGYYTVVGGGKNGELFVIERTCSSELKLFSYDTKTQHTVDLCFVQVSFSYSSVYLYVESLLPVMQANEIVLNK